MFLKLLNSTYHLIYQQLFLKKAEAWAKDNKCDGIECTARFGFWKWLGKSGWDKAYTVFERRFDNE